MFHSLLYIKYMPSKMCFPVINIISLYIIYRQVNMINNCSIVSPIAISKWRPICQNGPSQALVHIIVTITVTDIFEIFYWFCIGYSTIYQSSAIILIYRFKSVNGRVLYCYIPIFKKVGGVNQPRVEKIIKFRPAWSSYSSDHHTC